MIAIHQTLPSCRVGWVWLRETTLEGIEEGGCDPLIIEYGNTLYVGMALKKMAAIHSIASDQLKSLVIYTDRF